MKIIVCVKQVPDTSGVVKVNDNGTLDRASMQTIINPDDKNALEAALTLKDANPEIEVCVVTMGPPQAEGMLREVLAMGADQAYLVTARQFGGSDSYATSQILSAAIDTIGVGAEDIIMCGRQAIDGDTAQVGPQIGEKLDLPQVTYVEDIKFENGKLICKRQLEDGYMTIEVQTPCVLTAIKELNVPRYMSVGGIFDAFTKEINVLGFDELKEHRLIDETTIGLKGSPTNIYKSFTPEKKGKGMMLEGADKATVADLFAKLEAKHIL
ncbi:MAG: electron transfer flavoprotein subunit beta/FixA family protein [Clostridia bacterium]